MSLKQAYEIVVLDDPSEKNPVRARLAQYPQMLYTQGNLENLKRSPCIKGAFKDAIEAALINVSQLNAEKGIVLEENQPPDPSGLKHQHCGL